MTENTAGVQNTTPVTMPQASLNLIKEVLSMPGWYSSLSPQEIVGAASLQESLDAKLVHPSQAEQQADPNIAKEWNAKQVTFELTKKEIAWARAALEAAMKNGRLILGPYVTRAGNALGIESAR